MSLETGPSAPVANPAAPSPSPSTGQKLQFLSEQIEDDEAMLELLGEQDEDIAEPEGGELEDDDEEDIPPDTDPSPMRLLCRGQESGEVNLLRRMQESLQQHRQSRGQGDPKERRTMATMARNEAGAVVRR